MRTGGARIKRSIFRLAGNLLYLLSHSHTKLGWKILISVQNFGWDALDKIRNSAFRGGIKVNKRVLLGAGEMRQAHLQVYLMSLCQEFLSNYPHGQRGETKVPHSSFKMLRNEARKPPVWPSENASCHLKVVIWRLEISHNCENKQT